jgi:septum formation protein
MDYVFSQLVGLRRSFASNFKISMNFLIISKEQPLILASASPRRKRLLQQIGLPFLSLPSRLDEKQVAGESSFKAHIMAEKKAMAVHPKTNRNWILGADTIVDIDETILGKPNDHDEARSMLILLSGKEHKVTTGFCLLDPTGTVSHSEDVSTLVKMKRLTEEEIEAYINTNEPFGKAGSYAIQGIGSFMVEALSGSYTNVVGLPICALINSLLATGALKEFPLPS